jgi:lipopolysaccharide biosynthesis protein
MDNKLQFLAYYLPQFHPIPENDEWWEKGFTEWTNVTKAMPLFKDHYQPILPADLGFYDLRVPKVQEEQAELAKQYGIDGFIYYQYWFGNRKKLLEKPAENMLKNKKVAIPFCFCWANETWKGIWHGLDNPNVLIEQTYQGESGYVEYFNYLLPFFNDERYIKVDNKPMFHVYKLQDIPDLELFIETFNKMAIQSGFDGLYLVATISSDELVLNNEFIYGKVGLEVFNRIRYDQSFVFPNESFIGKIERKLCSLFNISTVSRTPFIVDYKKAVKRLEVQFPHKKFIACCFPNWDNSARSKRKSMIFKNATPQYWKNHLNKIVNEFVKHPENPNFVVIKSWNEWAEGNYLEPDLKYGHEWLEAIQEVKHDFKNLNTID